MLFTFCNLYILFTILTNCFQINHFIWSNGHSISTVNSKLPTCLICFCHSFQLFIIHCISIVCPVCHVCNFCIASINTTLSHTWATITINKKAINSHACTVCAINKKAIITHRALTCNYFRYCNIISQIKFYSVVTILRNINILTFCITFSLLNSNKLYCIFWVNICSLFIVNTKFPATTTIIFYIFFHLPPIRCLMIVSRF